MILYQNALIKLDYNPSTDILFIEWPHVEPYTLPEIRRTLELVVEYIRNYDVKKLLIDGSKTQVSPQLEEVEYKALVTQFVQDLKKTRLQKAARIITQDKVREARSKELAAELKQEVQLTVQDRSFATRSEALEWLLA